MHISVFTLSREEITTKFETYVERIKLLWLLTLLFNCVGTWSVLHSVDHTSYVAYIHTLQLHLRTTHRNGVCSNLSAAHV